MLILKQGNYAEQIKLAFSDILLSFKQYKLLFFLAREEIKQRYHRSLLGPLWITISMGVFIGGIGPIYSQLLKIDISDFFRTLSIGFVLWNLISGSISECCNAFISSEVFIKQVRLPYCLYILKILVKNFIIFLHNSVIVIIVLVVFPPPNYDEYYLLLFGFIILLANLFWIGMIAALVCTRFRDTAQLIANILQLLFFITPIIWSIEALHGREFVVQYNLFYYFIEIIRGTLIGAKFNVNIWIPPLCTALSGFFIAMLLFSKYRSRIIYWI